MIAHIFALILCHSLGVDRGDDLARGWRPVCLEIAEAAQLAGVDPAIAVSVGWHESRLYRDAIGALGEVSAMQVRPEMHCGGADCADRITAGVEVLARCLARHADPEAALCRYKGAATGCASGRARMALALRIGVAL